MMRTTGDVYLWPAAAERKLRMAYQAGLPAYLYGVTGVGKTSLIRHFLEKKEYFYVSALNTTPDDLESEKITAPVIVLDDLYAISDIRLKDAYYQKIQEWMERNRKEWKNLLQEAVSEAESYHFVRILTKEAGLWLPLLKKSREEIHWTDPHFHRQVLEEGKRMAQMYPGYLRTKAEGEVTLSDTARKILRMQAEGDSMNKIAGQLGLAEVTVKYHCRETYRKLGVNGKAAAVNEARKRKLI